MTCREKAEIEHPQCIDEDSLGGVVRCPNTLGYDVPMICKTGDYVDRTKINNTNCTKCWDQEIPEADSTFTQAVDDMIMDAVIEDLKTPRILDSGERREFESGAVRDIQEGKGRCDLMPLDVVALYIEGDPDQTDFVLWHIYLFQKCGAEHYLFGAIHEFNKKQREWRDQFTMMLETSKHFEEGAKKYGPDNWQKGIPVHCYIDSAVRHYLKFLRGDKDEPHDRAFVWNILCAIWTCKHKPELNEYSKEEE